MKERGEGRSIEGKEGQDMKKIKRNTLQKTEKTLKLLT